MKKRLSNPFVLIILTIVIIAIISFSAYFIHNSIIKRVMSPKQITTDISDNSPKELTEDDKNGIFYAQITDLSNGIITLTPGTLSGKTFSPGEDSAWLTASSDITEDLTTGDIIKYTTDGAKLVTAEKESDITIIPKSTTGI